MQAAVVNVPGQAPKYQTFPDPTPIDGEALVHVRAAGLHNLVKSIASGAHYSAAGAGPAVPGVDGVGVLDDGSRVYFLFVRKPWGTMAELAAAPRKSLIPVPDALSDAQAAAIPNPGMSAWISLKDRAGLSAGETVLILGATGVAGQLAIQVARLLGAKRVIAAGRNVDAIASANVDAVIALGQPEDALREAFTAEAASGIDVVIDYLWGRPTELLLEALAKGFKTQATHRTRLVEVGAMAGHNDYFARRHPAQHRSHLAGQRLRLRPRGSGPRHHSHAFQMAAAGKLTVAAEPVPLAEVESAWNRVEKGRRIVFTI